VDDEAAHKSRHRQNNLLRDEINETFKKGLADCKKSKIIKREKNINSGLILGLFRAVVNVRPI
jgi:hypothetical protein